MAARHSHESSTGSTLSASNEDLNQSATANSNSSTDSVLAFNPTQVLHDPNTPPLPVRNYHFDSGLLPISEKPKTIKITSDTSVQTERPETSEQAEQSSSSIPTVPHRPSVPPLLPPRSRNPPPVPPRRPLNQLPNLQETTQSTAQGISTPQNLIRRYPPQHLSLVPVDHALSYSNIQMKVVRLTRPIWCLEDIGPEEARRYLKIRNQGNFILRPTSNPQFGELLAKMTVAGKTMVMEFLIRKTARAFQLQTESATFEDLDTLVVAHMENKGSLPGNLQLPQEIKDVSMELLPVMASLGASFWTSSTPKYNQLE